MRFILYKMRKYGKTINPRTPPELMAFCVAFDDDETAFASHPNGVVVDTLDVQSIKIHTDGIMIAGYENSKKDDSYYRQQWWLTRPEVTK